MTPEITPPDEFREQLCADTLAAFGLDQPSSCRARLARWLPAQRRMRRRLLAMDRASAEARIREAAFAAALPGRMDAIADDLNQRLADVLPPGAHLEWTKGES